MSLISAAGEPCDPPASLARTSLEILASASQIKFSGAAPACLQRSCVAERVGDLLDLVAVGIREDDGGVVGARFAGVVPAGVERCRASTVRVVPVVGAPAFGAGDVAQVPVVVLGVCDGVPAGVDGGLNLAVG